MRGEFEVVNDLTRQRTGRMCEERRAKPRRDLRGNGAAADRGLALEDERFETSLSQVGRTRQAVDASANYDDVVLRRTHSSFSTRMAAFRPGAPMIPPPGCVAEPHM